MPIDTSAELPADPDAVLAVLSDEAFLRERAADLDTPVEFLQVGPGPSTELRLLASTAGIPPLFARFVGDSVSVLERQSWSADAAGGHRAVLDVRAQVFGRTVRLRGERRLLPVDGGGTRSTVTGAAEVDAPFIKKQAQGAVEELVLTDLRREEALLRRRLAQR